MLHGLVLLAALCAISLAQPAAAHTKLMTSPLDGAQLQLPPSAISLHFSQSIDTAFSDLTLWSAHRERIALIDKTIADRDDLLIRSPRFPLEPGDYVVEWQVLTYSGVPEAGEFRFSVNG